MNKNYKALRVKSVILFILFSGFLTSCEDKYDKIEKYQAPEWLVGKIYTQINDISDLSMFAQCIADVGYDTIIDKSGTYTAFAPNNMAFEAYFREKSYISVDDIPFEEKLRLVKFHLIQMPWNLDQLQGLSSKGWINVLDVSNNKPFAFKRQTLLKNDNKSYWVELITEGGSEYTIVPENESYKKIFAYSNSRKYAPLFFDDFLDAADLSGRDYSFYFDREYLPGNFYFAGGMMVGEEIYADNGFIYMIDRVIDPLRNAEELMDEGQGTYSYTEFKDLINLNSELTFNSSATTAQEGADRGEEVEELYDLSYPNLIFDINQELTWNPGSGDAYKYTIEFHNGIVVPTNEAFNQFVNDVLTGPGKRSDLSQIPANIKRLLVNGHMTDQPVYEQDTKNGFFNANGDYITIDESTIIQKSYGSNATFIGVDKVITPKAFSSVSAPLYLNPDFETFLAAYEKAKLLPALKNEVIQFTIFAIKDQTLANDMSMEVIWSDSRKDNFTIKGLDRSDVPEDPTAPPGKWVTRSREDITFYMNGLIAIDQHEGVAEIEFLETLDGRHIIIDNNNYTISGGESSRFGYNGDSAIIVDFTQVSGDFYNGEVYELNGWLSYSQYDLHSKLTDTKFLEHLKRAGLASEYEIYVTNNVDRYTLFLPSDNALDAFQADTLAGDALTSFLKSHFLKNELIFTDGKKQQGYYNTMSKVNSGTGFRYQELNISPGHDEISILYSDGDLYYKIEKESGVTNIITTVSELEGHYKTGTVIHKIDTVLVAY
ncbi:MAG: fasciclin domain-containing protein [Bacteroidales bacterium]|nr:fasciclin domain-containing protein [Bacteroidales bacterium]